MMKGRGEGRNHVVVVVVVDSSTHLALPVLVPALFTVFLCSQLLRHLVAAFTRGGASTRLSIDAP